MKKNRQVKGVERIADCCSDKIKCSGRLRLNGTLHGTDVEIFGNATINGYL